MQWVYVSDLRLGGSHLNFRTFIIISKCFWCWGASCKGNFLGEKVFCCGSVMRRHQRGALERADGGQTITKNGVGIGPLGNLRPDAPDERVRAADCCPWGLSPGIPGESPGTACLRQGHGEDGSKATLRGLFALFGLRLRHSTPPEKETHTYQRRSLL